MNVLLSLCISCISEENYRTEYPIGLFKTAEDVEAVIKRLMSEGGKFSEPNCEVQISKVEIVGEGFDIECVYRFYGQNINLSIKEGIIESPCYIDKSTAIQELMKAKKRTPRQQWTLETYIVGKSNW